MAEAVHLSHKKLSACIFSDQRGWNTGKKDGKANGQKPRFLGIWKNFGRQVMIHQVKAIGF